MFIHPPKYPTIHSLISQSSFPFIHSALCSSTHHPILHLPSIQASIYSFISPYVYPFSHPYIQISFIHSSLHSFICPCNSLPYSTSIHPSICPFTSPSSHPFISPFPTLFCATVVPSHPYMLYTLQHSVIISTFTITFLNKKKTLIFKNVYPHIYNF